MTTERNPQLEAALSKYRDLARDWHGGQMSPLYALASTGQVPDPEALRSEVNRAVDDAYRQLLATEYGRDLVRLTEVLNVLADHTETDA